MSLVYTASHAITPTVLKRTARCLYLRCAISRRKKRERLLECYSTLFARSQMQQKGTVLAGCKSQLCTLKCNFVIDTLVSHVSFASLPALRDSRERCLLRDIFDFQKTHRTATRRAGHLVVHSSAPRPQLRVGVLHTRSNSRTHTHARTHARTHAHTNTHTHTLARHVLMRRKTDRTRQHKNRLQQLCRLSFTIRPMIDATHLRVLWVGRICRYRWLIRPPFPHLGTASLAQVSKTGLCPLPRIHCRLTT